jgi:hypothetical protein
MHANVQQMPGCSIRNRYPVVVQAQHNVVHGFLKGTNQEPKGASALAPEMGLSNRGLSNKVNKNQSLRGLMLEEAVYITERTQDFRMLYAFSMSVNHVSIPLGDFSDTSNTDLLELYARLNVEIGEHATAVLASLEDGDINEVKVREARREFQDVIRAGLELNHRFEALC